MKTKQRQSVFSYLYRRLDNGELVEVKMTAAQHAKRQDVDGKIILRGGIEAMRDTDAERARASGRLVSGAYNRPLVSVSQGCHPDQIPEFREQARKAGITGIDFTKDGDAVFSSRGQRAKYLKLRGCKDNDGGYGD